MCVDTVMYGKIKVPRFFFAGDMSDVQPLQVRYAFKCKAPNERGKRKIWREFVSRYYDLQQNLRL